MALQRWACSAISGFAMVLFSGAGMASTYNEGFLAAESGNYQLASAEWGQLAAEGHAIAQFNLGLLYHGGLGVELNEQKAVQLYEASAEQGYQRAQEFMAVGYAEGWFGLPKDATKAAYWEQKIQGE